MSFDQVGISSVGIYVPIYRLSTEVLRQIWGQGGASGERAVANFDEDSITLAVEAGIDCLEGTEPDSIDALYFASTTAPYKEKQSSSIIAAALDMREDILTADFTGSIRSGTIALRAAVDAVRAGSAKRVMVVAADCRIPPPNSTLEPVFGDGAVAFLIESGEVAAELEGSYSVASEFLDIWRLEEDRITRTWEDRFIYQEGYFPNLKRAISELQTSCKLALDDFAKLAFYAPDARRHREMVRYLGLRAEQIADPLFDRVGNTGTAFALMIFAGALEKAQPGERILLANYGDGADAYAFRVRDPVKAVKDKSPLKRKIESKLMLESYGKYIKFKKLMEFESTPDFRPRTSLPQLWRDRKWVYRFHGHRCKTCGKVQYPLQKACMYCRSRELEEVRLSKRGTLFTFSIDERAPVIDPPNVLAAVRLEGGGRFFSEMTDRDVKSLRVGMEMEITFRRIHDALGVHNYFWKCKPARK